MSFVSCKQLYIHFDGFLWVVVAVARSIVFVADTDNHVIRRIDLDGTTTIVAGRTRFATPIPGCPEPCIEVSLPFYKIVLQCKFLKIEKERKSTVALK